MDQLTITAASGLRDRIESLDLLANNIANAATTGYKADREFHNIYLSAEASAGDTDPALLPVIEKNWIDFAQGMLTDTKNPTDLALQGAGFFVADTPGGPLYTRNGAFRIAPTGVLETREGYPVRAAGKENQKDKSLRVQPDGGPIDVHLDGTVWQQGQEMGRIYIAELPKQESVEKSGHTYFRFMTGNVPPQTAKVEVHQGRLESSNVGPAESAVKLVSVLRQFEMLQRAVTLGAEMNRKAMEEVARVSS